MDAGGSKDTVELRGDIPRELADVLDAVSIAEGRSRVQQVIVVISEWAERQRRIATVLHQITKRNPARPDS
jgi:hypothetical protein